MNKISYTVDDLRGLVFACKKRLDDAYSEYKSFELSFNGYVAGARSALYVLVLFTSNNASSDSAILLRLMDEIVPYTNYLTEDKQWNT